MNPRIVVVIRHEPGQPKPWVAGYYTATHRWSPLTACSTATEATVHAASVNRRTGVWK